MLEFVLVALGLLLLVAVPRGFSRRNGRVRDAHDAWRNDTPAVSWSSGDAPSSHDSGSCDSGDSSSSAGDCGGSDSGGSSSD